MKRTKTMRKKSKSLRKSQSLSAPFLPMTWSAAPNPVSKTAWLRSSGKNLSRAAQPCFACLTTRRSWPLFVTLISKQEDACLTWCSKTTNLQQLSSKSMKTSLWWAQKVERWRSGRFQTKKSLSIWMCTASVNKAFLVLWSWTVLATQLEVSVEIQTRTCATWSLPPSIRTNSKFGNLSTSMRSSNAQNSPSTSKSAQVCKASQLCFSQLTIKSFVWTMRRLYASTTLSIK